MGWGTRYTFIVQGLLLKLLKLKFSLLFMVYFLLRSVQAVHTYFQHTIYCFYMLYCFSQKCQCVYGNTFKFHFAFKTFRLSLICEGGRSAVRFGCSPGEEKRGSETNDLKSAIMVLAPMICGLIQD